MSEPTPTHENPRYVQSGNESIPLETATPSEAFAIRRHEEYEALLNGWKEHLNDLGVYWNPHDAAWMRRTLPGPNVALELVDPTDSGEAS